MSHFHPPEVVGRGSQTQRQVDENYLIDRFKRYENPLLKNTHWNIVIGT